MKYKSLDKKAITIMRINAFISLLIVCIIFFIFQALNIDMSREVSYIVYPIFGILLFILLLNALIFPSIRYQRYKYYISKEMVDVKKGLFIITRSLVPIERVQKIELTNGPIDRYYGLSTVVIYTAAGTVDVKFLDNDEAQKITDELNNIIKDKLNEVK